MQIELELLQEYMKCDAVSISIGYSYRDSDVDVEIQTRIADKEMYAQKELHRREQHKKNTLE